MSNVSLARPQSLFSGVISDDVPELQRDIGRLREQIGSGTRVNRPSDNPDAFAVAEEMTTIGNQLDRHQKSVEAARSFVNRTEQELAGLAELFTQAREEGIRAENEALSDSDRESLAQSLESIKDEVVDRMNAQHDGEFIFGGNRTDTKPFNQDGTVNGTAGDIDGGRERTIGPNQTLDVNVTGKELHEMGGGQTITGALDTLIEAVRPNNGVNDIQSALGDVESAQDHVLSKGSKAGTVSRRLSTAQDQLEVAKLNVERRRSDVEDTNVAKAVSELQQKQTQLQAALRATASSQQTSLIDFLG